MIKSVLKTAILMIAVVGGGVGGSIYKDMSSGDAAASGNEAHAKADKKDSHSKDKKSDKKDGDSKSEGGEVRYQKFKRQFVIPVMGDKKIKSLVIMNFNLELNEDAPSNSFSLEPKLRDAFMKDLLMLSNEGVFSDDLTSPESYEEIRETLLGSSRRILNDGVNDVLILDIAKRDA
jgi:hypothetical protein